MRRIQLANLKEIILIKCIFLKQGGFFKNCGIYPGFTLYISEPGRRTALKQKT